MHHLLAPLFWIHLLVHTPVVHCHVVETPFFWRLDGELTGEVSILTTTVCD